MCNAPRPPSPTPAAAAAGTCDGAGRDVDRIELGEREHREEDDQPRRGDRPGDLQPRVAPDLRGHRTASLAVAHAARRRARRRRRRTRARPAPAPPCTARRSGPHWATRRARAATHRPTPTPRRRRSASRPLPQPQAPPGSGVSTPGAVLGPRRARRVPSGLDRRGRAHRQRHPLSSSVHDPFSTYYSREVFPSLRV